MSTAKTLAKGTFWGLFAAFALKFLSWLYYIVIARVVSVEEIGVFSSALSVLSVVILFSDLGMGMGSVGRYVPFYAGKGHFNHVRRVLRLSSSVVFVSSLVFMAAILVFAGPLSDFYHNPRMVPVFYILAFYILFYNFYSLATSFLTGRKLIKKSSSATTSQGVGRLVFTLALVFSAGALAESLAAGFVLSFLFAGFVGWRFVLKEYRRLPEASDRANGREMLSEMVPFGMTLVILYSMYLVNMQFDTIMLGHLLPAETNMRAVGIYTLVVTFGTLTNIFANSIGSIFHPVINELWVQDKTEEMESASETYLRWIAVLTVPVIVAIFVYSSELISIVYGDAYSEGYMTFIIYSFGLFVYSFSYPVQNTLSGMRRLDVTTKIVFLGVVVNVCMNLFMIPRYGMEGAAFASATSFIIMTGAFLYVRDMTRLRIPKDIYKPLLSGIAAAIVLVALKTALSFQVLPDASSADLAADLLRKAMKAGYLVVIAVSVAVSYLFFMRLLRAFGKEDVDIVVAGMKRIGLPAKYRKLAERLLIRP